MRIPPLATLSGISLVISGSLVLAGWLLHEPTLVRLFSGFDSIPSLTALGFILAGWALIVSRPLKTPDFADRFAPPPTPGSRLSLTLAGLLVLLGSAALVLWYNGISFGLGLGPASFGKWLTDANPYPDRMRPMAAVGFISLGIVIALLKTARTAAGLLAAQLLSLIIVLLGLLEMLGQRFGLTGISDGYLGIVFHAGMGFALCGIGLFSLELRDERFQRFWHQDDSRKISFVGATIIVLTGLIGIFGSFAVFYPQVETELQNNLQLSLKDRRDKFQSALESGGLASRHFANQPLRLEAMAQLNANPQDREHRAALQKVADSYRSFGFSGVLFRDLAGRDVAHAGTFLREPELSIPLRTASPSTLLWKGGFVLRTQVVMEDQGRTVGTLEGEYPLPQLGTALHDTANIGETTDFAVCAMVGKNIHCFPFRSTGGKVLRDLPPTFDGKPIPVSYALAGKTGVVRTKDYRGRDVIAAYAPIGPLGLGSVLKIDAAELYQPIAAKLEQLFGLLFVLGAAGVVLLHFQVTPLVQKMAKEISERKAAEANLMESEERFRLISTSANVGIVIIDPEEKISYWNPAAERIFGYQAGEVLRKQFHALLAPARYRGDVQQGFEHFIQAGKGPVLGKTLSVTALRKGGEEFSAELSVSAFRIKGQWHALGIIQDITERKRMEQELQQLNQTLERQVQEEVGKNLEKERMLIQQSRLAALGEMISNIAHQWRQPINALGLVLANIKDAYEYGELDQSYLDKSVSHGTHLIQSMSSTIDDFRNFFKPTSEKKRFRMCEGVTDAVRLVKDSFHNSGVEVTIENCDLPCFVEGHPSEYSQVVLNVLSNAKDAIVARKIRGDIRIRTEMQGNHSVVSIRDNGGGIPADVLPKIFDPYFTTKERGTGIGLYMSKMIMEKMGGDITVRNIDGGAEALISLPIVPD